MATIGHGLVGLAMAQWVSPAARHHRLPTLWPGLVVLLAYAVDLAEWFAVIFDPDLPDRYFLTHSPLLVAPLAAGVCAVLGGYCRLRRPWGYVVIVAVIFSHLAMDWHVVRVGVVEWYSGTVVDEDQVPGYSVSVPAELCVYGAPLVWTLLIRSAIRQDCSRGARRASWVLAGVSAVAAMVRHPAFWVPVYAVSLLHAAVLLRRELSPRLLWNGVPLSPLFALGFAAWLAGHRLGQGMRLAEQGLYEEAIRRYEAALRVPARSGRTLTYLQMGWSYEKLGDLATAEQMYRKVLLPVPQTGSPEVVLAGFYLRHPGTAFYGPVQAARLYQLVLDTPGTRQDLHLYARTQLSDLRASGLIPGG